MALRMPLWAALVCLLVFLVSSDAAPRIFRVRGAMYNQARTNLGLGVYLPTMSPARYPVLLMDYNSNKLATFADGKQRVIPDNTQMTPLDPNSPILTSDAYTRDVEFVQNLLNDSALNGIMTPVPAIREVVVSPLLEIFKNKHQVFLSLSRTIFPYYTMELTAAQPTYKIYPQLQEMLDMLPPSYDPAKQDLYNVLFREFGAAFIYEEVQGGMIYAYNLLHESICKTGAVTTKEALREQQNAWMEKYAGVPGQKKLDYFYEERYQQTRNGCWGGSVETCIEQFNHTHAYSNWMNTLWDDSEVVMFKLRSISTLLPIGPKRDGVEQALQVWNKEEVQPWQGTVPPDPCPGGHAYEPLPNGWATCSQWSIEFPGRCMAP